MCARSYINPDVCLSRKYICVCVHNLSKMAVHYRECISGPSLVWDLGTALYGHINYIILIRITVHIPAD